MPRRRLFLPLLCLLLLMQARAVFAQAQEIDFNGLPIGTTAREYYRVYPFHACKPGVCVFDSAQCATRKIEHCREFSSWFGVPVSNLKAEFTGGKLSKVILTYPSARFHELAALLRQKYGTPSEDRLVPAHMMVPGSSALTPIDDQLLAWRRPASQLMIVQYSGTGGSVVIQTYPAAAARP
jgi:hypothetical protein